MMQSFVQDDEENKQIDLRRSFLDLSQDEKVNSFIYNFKNLDKVLDKNKFY